jgi:predicted dithiol-disulfide oxidoreductase (DUF899 family)
MTMTNPLPAHQIGTRDEWRAARLALLQAEKDLTRHGDEVTRQRQNLPWVPVEKEYRFVTEVGEQTLSDLFRGRSQLMVYHFMYGPDWTEGCPRCSSFADGFNGIRAHLENHDVAFAAISRAPLDKLLAYRERMGWNFPWASSVDSDFNFDYSVSFTEDSVARGAEYNFRAVESSHLELPHESHGLSAFVRDGATVFHTYSTYARGVDALWDIWQWLDRAPLGRNEGDMSWFHRHDEYPREPRVAGD